MSVRCFANSNIESQSHYAEDIQEKEEKSDLSDKENVITIYNAEDKEKISYKSKSIKGIIVEVITDKDAFDEEVRLVVNPLNTTAEEIEGINKSAEIIALDISFQNEEGEEKEPTHTVEVSFNYTQNETLSNAIADTKKEVTLLHDDEKEGLKTLLNLNETNLNNARVQTESFSPYYFVIQDIDEDTEGNSDKNTEEDNTQKQLQETPTNEVVLLP